VTRRTRPAPTRAEAEAAGRALAAEMVTRRLEAETAGTRRPSRTADEVARELHRRAVRDRAARARIAREGGERR
jgi:hypothetical protein